MPKIYNYRNCQSLFGYALTVHQRFNCVCQLCKCGGNDAPSFDIWRQMTVEHIIGKSQGGYKEEIGNSINERFPDLSKADRETLAEQLNEANTISACSFCNSTTSRNKAPQNMHELIFEAEGNPEEVINQVIEKINCILRDKQKVAAWKIEAVRKAFEEKIMANSSE